MLEAAIAELIAYALRTGLILEEDGICTRNRLLERLRLSAYTLPEHVPENTPLEDILAPLVAHAVTSGLITDTAAARDNFEAALMGELTPRPSEVVRAFWANYAHAPETATDEFYQFCHHTNYIRGYRTEKDKRWQTDTPFGPLDITINLAKPERDPKDIAAARTMPQQSGKYPACLLCFENEGYAGRADHPARQNHRIIPITLCGEAWALQYSPYVYYNEHCIVLNKYHTPMVIDAGTFTKMLAFLELFPHYFIGSNADLPIVGGSILNHDHFQGGRYTFPMERAPEEAQYRIAGYADVSLAVVRWPLSVLRLRGSNAESVIALATHLLNCWRAYSDASADIHAHTGDAPHNTVTPIARKRGAEYELDLALRNNRTSDAYPAGIFHPHTEVHNIKRENIGLIEVMGLAILPARLQAEMQAVKSLLLTGGSLRSLEDDPLAAPHAAWCESWRSHYTLTEDNIDAVLQTEIGKTFALGLTHAGVFKHDAKGRAALARFLAHCGAEEC